MSSRFARIVSRLSIVSVVAVSALGAAACSKAGASGTQAAAEPVKAAPAQHGPGYHVFREIEGLDLRASQREAIAEVEQNLAADFAPHRETMRQVAESLAKGIESGKLDQAEVDAHRAALTAAVADVHDSIAGALNEVHDVLDQGQRAELVARLRARHERHAEPQDEAHRQQAMARFATELGLTEDQKQAIHEAVRDASEKVFPDRKARREAWEAKMKALSDAFVRDDFDAEDFDPMSGAEEAITSFTQIAERAVDASGKILGPTQRLALAALIRERANAPQRQ
jgi:Spy/CpxP family protein refolding chaperone